MVVVMLNAKVRESGVEENVEQSFLKALSLLEQAHRRLHDVVKDNLERNGERSLTGVQALLLYEIGESETPASALRARGSFAGTSMSYNVKKLQEGGYLVQSRPSDDRRTVRLKLTPSGRRKRDEAARRTVTANSQLLQGFTDNEIDTVVRWLAHAAETAAPQKRQAKKEKA